MISTGFGVVSVGIWRLKCRRCRDLEWFSGHIVYGRGGFCVLFGETSRGVVPHRSQNCSYGGPARMRSCPRNTTGLWSGRLHTPYRSAPPVFAAPPHRFVPSCFSALAGASLPRPPSIVQVHASPRPSGTVAQRGRIGGFDPGACRRGAFERAAAYCWPTRLL